MSPLLTGAITLTLCAYAVAMLIALFWVHLGNGFFMASNGFEYAMTLAVISVVLLVEGAGRLSVDARLQG